MISRSRRNFNSAQSDFAREDEDWTHIKDRQQRRRIQNRIAQRIYRERRRNGDPSPTASLSPRSRSSRATHLHSLSPTSPLSPTLSMPSGASSVDYGVPQGHYMSTDMYPTLASDWSHPIDMGLAAQSLGGGAVEDHQSDFAQDFSLCPSVVGHDGVSADGAGMSPYDVGPYIEHTTAAISMNGTASATGAGTMQYCSYDDAGLGLPTSMFGAYMDSPSPSPARERHYHYQQQHQQQHHHASLRAEQRALTSNPCLSPSTFLDASHYVSSSSPLSGTSSGVATPRSGYWSEPSPGATNGGSMLGPVFDMDGEGYSLENSEIYDRRTD